MKKRNFNEEGSGLILAVTSLAVLGVSAMLMTSRLNSAFKAEQRSADTISKQALARFFTEATDCDKSTYNKVCHEGWKGESGVLRRTGSNEPIATMSGSGVKYGEWTVRLECFYLKDEYGLNGFQVSAARLAPGGTLESTADADFLPDPLTGKIVKWTNLFPAGQTLCSQGGQNNWYGSKISTPRPVRIESGSDELADTCFGTVDALNLCSGYYYKKVKFAKPFRNPPLVLVSISRGCDAALTPCSKGLSTAHESGYDKWSMVTSTGFQFSCNGAVTDRTSCGGVNSLSKCAARCNWMAIGE